MEGKRPIMLLAVIVISIIGLLSCAAPSTTPPESTPPESAPPTTPEPAEPKTLEIGVSAFLGWPIGLDFVHGTDVMAKMINDKGGLDIGGEKYKIEFIVYDSQMDQAVEVASINKLVYEDKVKFIISDGTNVAAWVPITEENKVVVNVGTPSPDILNPELNYTFNSAIQNCGQGVVGWFANKFPEKKNFMQAVPDNTIGHLFSEINKRAYDNFGINIEIIFYPPDSQDLSAIGTKVKDKNPDVFSAIAGGPILDGLCLKAAYQAGYEGQFFIPATQPVAVMSTAMPIEALEGYIGPAFPVEFEPAQTQIAQEFKEAWVAEYGNYEFPEVMTTASWSCLETALQQAGSTDVDKVAGVIANGLKYEGPTGPCMMVSRPDMGNNKTVDSVCAYYIKKVVDGKLTVFDQLTLEQAAELNAQAWQ